MDHPHLDFLVVGAGMAGASVAANLAPHARVAVIEAERQPGYHTTGRSAALFSELYGNAQIRALTRASRRFLYEPPAGFAEVPLVRPRATLFFSGPDDLPTLQALLDDPANAGGIEALTEPRIRELIPVFRPGVLAAGAIEPGSADIDVNALHQGFLRAARAAGASLHLDCPLRSLRRDGDRWTIEAGALRLSASTIVNAAGAWADEVYALAGGTPLGIQPLRRTAVLIDPPADVDCASWPAAIDIAEHFYFKPDAGLLLLSPADEEPSVPCDAQPEDLDVAIAVDRYEQATGQPVRRVRHRWAGLRVFAPDRTPVVGHDAAVDGFFWLAALGGYGIQTADAAGRLAAALALRQAVPADILAQGVDPAALGPARFAG